MCGIVGIVHLDPERPCGKEPLVYMRDLMRHRGPDEEGIFLGDQAGLGHRRLSIIDLSSGQQPMCNEDGTLWITYNGEIYNYRDLYDDLLSRGHTFKSRADTEVILHMYEEEGENCLRHFNGMFAFAIWDRRNRTLFLARDRMGVKPLYYAMTKGAFLFSSEIKSLVGSGYLGAECNDDAFLEYFLYRCTSGESTLFKGVRSLMPAQTLVLKDGRVTIRNYWSPFPTPGAVPIDPREATEKLHTLIKDSVRLRMVSDVPLGTFCSGGLDSSLVTAMVSGMVGGEAINTFSVGFHEPEYDESRYARLVSSAYRTKHHEIRVGNEEFADHLPKMIWHNDEPLNFANSVQIFALSRLSKLHVTVVLTGEGSDELFAGYSRYFIPGILDRMRRLHIPASMVLRVLSKLSGDHRLRKLLELVDLPIRDVVLGNSGFLRREYVEPLLSRKFDLDIQFREYLFDESTRQGLDLVGNLSRLDQKTYLVSILNRQDKMSMAASIESRVPFLDYRIVEFANALPLSCKQRFLTGKHIVKKIAERYLPGEVVYRKKSGFGVPIAKWMREKKGLGPLLSDLVESCSAGYFDKSRVSNLYTEHRKGREDHSEALWSYLNFSLWLQTINSQTSLPDVRVS
jgi:asparagine synthase (glutamine-hydrolysing)